MRFAIRVGFLLGCFLIVVQGQQQHLAAPPLRIDDLVAEALRVNPEILGAQKRAEAAKQRPRQQASLPDPMLSLGYSSNGRPWPGAGLGVEPTSNIGFMVSQQLPGPGKLRLREALAEREADAVSQDWQQVQRSVIGRLKLAYHRLHHTWTIHELLERNQELMLRIVRVTETRYAVGKATQADVLKAQTQISLLATRLERTEQERRSQEATINILLARSPEDPLGRPGMQRVDDIPVTLAQLYEQVRLDSPVLKREQKVMEQSELALNLARKDRYPDYTVSAGYFNMGRMADMYEVRVDINLPNIFNGKKSAAISEQASLVSQARRQYEATDQSLLLRVKDDYLMSSASLRLMKMYSDTLIPQASLTLEASMAAYETGQADFLTLLSNLSALLEFETNYHEEMMNYHLALVRLEELTGLVLVKE